MSARFLGRKAIEPRLGARFPIQINQVKNENLFQEFQSVETFFATGGVCFPNTLLPQ
jgi:hypothetical protein